MSRRNKDCTPDRSSYGRKLVEVCRNNNVVIFNGRIGDDKDIGNYTTTYNTTIDYVIGTYNTVAYVKKFKVLGFEPMLSDVHCGLLTELEFPCGKRQTCRERSEMEKIKLMRPGKWINEKKEEYVGEVDVNRVHELLHLVDHLSVNDVTHQLKLLLIEGIS